MFSNYIVIYTQSDNPKHIPCLDQVSNIVCIHRCSAELVGAMSITTERKINTFAELQVGIITIIPLSNYAICNPLTRDADKHLAHVPHLAVTDTVAANP